MPISSRPSSNGSSRGSPITARARRRATPSPAASASARPTVTLQVLADMAQGKTVHFYAPTLELGAEVVAKAQALGLDAVLIRGREANKDDPDRWPALCQKDDVAATLGRSAATSGKPCAERIDEFGNVTTASTSHGCPYVAPVRRPRGQAGRAGARISDPAQDADRRSPRWPWIDERFHTTLIRTADLPLEPRHRAAPVDARHRRRHGRRL